MALIYIYQMSELSHDLDHDVSTTNIVMVMVIIIIIITIIYLSARFCNVCGRHEETVDQLYLQLRSDLLSDRFSCSTEQAVHLGALALRMEHPDSRRPDRASVERYVAPSLLHSPVRTHLCDSLLHEFDRVLELSCDHARLQFIQVGYSVPCVSISSRCFRLLKIKFKSIEFI